MKHSTVLADLLQSTGSTKKSGQSGGELLSLSRRVVVLQSRIPLIEFPLKRAVKGLHPSLQHEMCAVASSLGVVRAHANVTSLSNQLFTHLHDKCKLVK